MLVHTLSSLGTLGAFGALGKHGPKDPHYQKAKEFTLCLEEIAKNYDRQVSALAASSSVGKQLSQSFATYRKVAAFHQPIFPIVEFLQKSNTWLTSAEELSSKFFTTLNDKTFTPTKNNVRSQTSNLKAIKAKNIQNEKLSGVHQTLRREDIAPKKTSEQCACEIEEMTMSSLYTFWESYVEYFEEGQKLMHKVRDGVLYMKKLSVEAAKTKRLGIKKVFGVSLEELAEREAPAYLPQVLENMLATVSKLVSLEGIFRVSGSKTGMDSLREAIDSGAMPDFNAVPDPHTVPSLFKSFLRMLPVPLIPYESFEMVPNLTAPSMSTPALVNHLKALVHSLPPAHYHLLGRLLALCSKIVAEQAVTKMNASNIAVVIGPNIIRPPESPSTPDSFGDSNTLVRLLVDHFEAIYPEKLSMVQEDPTKPTTSIRKQRAHGVTIDKSTVNTLNWEAQVALSNQEQPFPPSNQAPTQSSAHQSVRSAGVPSPASESGVAAALATKDASTAFRPSTRPATRAMRSNTDAPLSNAARAAQNSVGQNSFLAPTRNNIAPPASSAPVPASSAPAPASTSSHVTKFPIIGYHPKTLPTPPISSASPSSPTAPISPTSPSSPSFPSSPTSRTPSPPKALPSPPSGSPPSPSSRAKTPPSLTVRPSSPSFSAGPSSPVSLNFTPQASSAASSVISSSPPVSSSPPSSGSSLALGQSGKSRIIGKSPPKKPPSLSSLSISVPASSPDAAQSPPAQTQSPPAQTQQATQPLSQQTAAALAQQAAASTKGSFRVARPSARDAQSPDASLESVKAEILRTLSNIVTGQIRVARGKFAEVNSIPDGVPFIHVLKAVTPELDRLKKVMPTPPTFEKLPELPADQSKFTRLKFTIDFALQDFARVLEHVSSFVASQSDVSAVTIALLHNILQAVAELHRILGFNINKL